MLLQPLNPRNLAKVLLAIKVLIWLNGKVGKVGKVGRFIKTLDRAVDKL